MSFEQLTEQMHDAQSEKSADPLRTSVRFPLQLPVRLQVGEREMAAVTEDISASGALFSMAELPPVDARVEWILRLPAEVMGASSDVTVHCIGRVVRHREDESGKHAGVLIDEYTFKEGKQ